MGARAARQALAPRSGPGDVVTQIVDRLQRDEPFDLRFARVGSREDALAPVSDCQPLTLEHCFVSPQHQPDVEILSLGDPLDGIGQNPQPRTVSAILHLLANRTSDVVGAVNNLHSFGHFQFPRIA